MGATNGYFKLHMEDDGTYIELFPQVGDGEPVSLEEIRTYLASKNYTVDVITLNKALMNLTGPTSVKIKNEKGLPEAETFIINISADKMMATARFYPCSNLGASLTKDEIVASLKFKGVQVGIDENVISAYLSNKHYCTDYVIAKGKPVVQGTDASIEYFFNTNPNTKPSLNSDGTVDFYNLNIISKCTIGQELARLTPEQPGVPGQNVLGENISPKDVRKLILKFGRNIELSPDGLALISQVNGHVTLTDDKVFVTDVYEVTDVDTSTGNIDYNGNVVVMGNVKAGFSVHAEGNVEVRGIVEGALIQAQGDIIITRGMNGMGRGKLQADGNIVAKFIENASISAGGYVHAEAILHSNVTATGDVEVTGKKGFITGGSIRSLGTVSARVIGSSMGADTEIEVGVDPSVKNQLNALQQEVTTIKKEIAQIEPILQTVKTRIKRGDKLTPEQIRYFKQLSDQYSKLRPELEQKMSEIDNWSSSADVLKTESIVKVSEFIYPGTKITISEAVLNVTNTIQHSRLVKEGADVRIKGF